MKQLLTHALLCLIVSFCTYFNVLAAESGWEQKTGYKYQKLLIKDLVSLHLSPNNDSIFTYNKDGFLRIWDFESGGLLDSVDFTDKTTLFPPNLFQFSSDGKTAVVSYYRIDTVGTYSEFNLTKARIVIFDISSKLILKKGYLDLNIISSIYSNEYIHGYIPIYNFIYEKKLLLINSGIRTFQSFGAAAEADITGYLGIIENKNDTFQIKKQIHIGETTDYLFINDSLLLISSSYYHQVYYYKSGYADKYQTLYSIKKQDLIKDSSTYLIYSRTERDGRDVPDYLKISRIFTTSMKDTILYKNNFKYFYFDLGTNTIIPNLTISFPNTLIFDRVIEGIYDTKDVLVQCQDSVFYFNNIQTTNRIDSIISPIGVDSFFIAKNNKSLIAYNSSGEIVVLPIGHITAVSESNTSESTNPISISPNPTSTYFTISGLLGATSVNIVNSLGMEILKQQVNTPQLYLDATGYANGVYFVRFQTSAGLVSKKFVVYR